MPQPNYIPAKDADFALWLQNFATLIAAAPATFGLTAGDAAIITPVNTAFQASYLAATDPATRTSVTVATKTSDRAAAEATVRPYAVQISRNPAVTDGDKVAVGVSLPPLPPTPIPPPATNPALALIAATDLQHQLSIRDVTTPTSKKKPYGVIGAEVWVAVGEVPAVDPMAGNLKATTTKTPARFGFQPEQRGKTATYFARWVTRSGPDGVAQPGPWSAPLAIVIV